MTDWWGIDFALLRSQTDLVRDELTPGKYFLLSSAKDLFLIHI
jgi:hypothetical protein